MAIALRTIAFPYRAVASFVILVGIARVSGLWSADPSWNSFLYYTVMSNVLCLVWMVWSAIVTLRDPLLVIAGWLLFIPKGRLRPYDPLLWAIIPYAYLVCAFTYSALGGEFAPGVRVPYPFMNIETNGLGGVVLWIAGLTVALVAVGYVSYGVDRLLARVAPSRRDALRTQTASTN